MVTRTFQPQFGREIRILQPRSQKHYLPNWESNVEFYENTENYREKPKNKTATLSYTLLYESTSSFTIAANISFCLVLNTHCWRQKGCADCTQVKQNSLMAVLIVKLHIGTILFNVKWNILDSLVIFDISLQIFFVFTFLIFCKISC